MQSIRTMFNITIITIFWFFLCVSAVQASVIIPESNYSEKILLTQTVRGDVDILHINKANGAGVSVNYFKQFEVVNKPLNLINISQNVSTKLIVIIADDILLKNTVEIIGQTADILFISTATDGVIDCLNCSLNNVFRFSFVTAEPDRKITDTTNSIGKIQTTSFGAINIAGLNAPGALAFDVVTNDLNLIGQINLHQRVNKDFMGSYTVAFNGKYSMGSGSVNLILGDTKWNYEYQEIISFEPSKVPIILKGSIKSVGVKISTSANTVINTYINTRTDLLTTVRYRDQVNVSQENITIQTIGGQNLSVIGNQQTDGSAFYKTTGSLNLGNSKTKINAENIEVIVGKTLKNYAQMNATNIEMAGLNIRNEGKLSSSQNIEIWAEKNIVNQYGGYLYADTIKLQSKKGLIRNGSRTPYKLHKGLWDDLLYPKERLAIEDRIDTFARWTGAQRTDLTGPFFQPNYVSYLMNTLEPEKIGTFYTDGMSVEVSNNSYQMAVDNSARIVGNHIEVVSTAFENINPYYEKRDDRGFFNISVAKANQVIVGAVETLKVLTTDYIINSSAVLEVSSESGVLHLKTGLLTNERYRLLTTLDLEVNKVINNTEPTSGFFSSISTETNTITVGTKNIVVSPSGLLLTFGDLIIEASQGFINNTAYLEVFGNADFNTPMINSIGVEHEVYERIRKITESIAIPDFAMSRTTSQESLSLKTIPLDTLFFIQGDAKSNASLVEFINHKLIDRYIDQAIDNVRERVVRERNVIGRGWSSRVIEPSIETTLSEDKTKINFTGQVYIDAPNTRYDGATGTINESFSVFDELINLFNNMKNYIKSIFSEINWWDSGDENA